MFHRIRYTYTEKKEIQPLMKKQEETKIQTETAIQRGESQIRRGMFFFTPEDHPRN